MKIISFINVRRYLITMVLKTEPVSLRMPVVVMDRIRELADEKGLTPEMTARSVLCEHFKQKKV